MTDLNSNQHSCTYLRGLNWHTYNYLNTRLNDLSKYISFATENKDTWSETLADLLILTGSAADSFFRDMGGCPYIKAESNYKKVQNRVLNRKNPNWNIHDFRNVYESLYELSQNSVNVPFGLSNYGSIQPFSQFNLPNGVPIWWDAYNHLKHEYYEHLTEANLDNVINALGALLILNVIHRCSQQYLILRRLLTDRYGQTSPGYIIEVANKSKLGFIKRTSFIGGLIITTSNFVFNVRAED